MSLKTWMKEFYKVPSNRVKSDIEALDHSILKWEGLREENLEKHNLVHIANSPFITELGTDDSFMVDSRSCALCHLYLLSECEGCPLYISLSNAMCNNVYRGFFIHGNVLPMQDALEVAKREYLEEHKDDK